MKTVQDEYEVTRTARALLEGAGFEGFSFGTNFSLRFTRDRLCEVEGHEIPPLVELWIGADWWFGDRERWKAKVTRMAPTGAVEPDEPVFAYELAALRWSEGSVIRSATLDASSLRLVFANGRAITVANSSAGDYAWTLTATARDGSIADWSVTAEDGALFVRAPYLGEE